MYAVESLFGIYLRLVEMNLEAFLHYFYSFIDVEETPEDREFKKKHKLRMESYLLFQLLQSVIRLAIFPFDLQFKNDNKRESMTSILCH